MSEPKNHHYVPKVYLKAFANFSKVLYQVKRNYRKITETNTTKICYLPNYNTIKRHETKIINKINDALLLEKNTFKKQEDIYEQILKRITKPSFKPFTVSNADARKFLEILVFIKRRNPSVRRMLTDKYKDYINSPSFQERIKPGVELAKKIDKIPSEEFITKFLNEINTDSTRLDDTYLLSFLQGDTTTDKVLDTLMQFKLYVHHAPSGYQFITSDNPGFIIVDDIVSNYGGLAENFTYGFPLTPLCCLFIHADEPDDSYLIQKPIHPKQITFASMEGTNKATAAIANDKVFSYSKEVLNQFLASQPNF